MDKEEVKERDEDTLVRKGMPKGLEEDHRADEMPYGEGRVDAAIFNGVHTPQGDGRPSVDTGHRLHSTTLALESEKLKNEPAAAPVTSQGALAQDLAAAMNTAPPVASDPVEVPHKNFPAGEDTKAETKPHVEAHPLSRPAPAGSDAKSKAPEHSKK